MSSASVSNLICEWVVEEPPIANVAPPDAPEKVLSKGTTFSSTEEAILFYKNYGASKGFNIRIRSSDSKQKGPDKTSMRLVCSREGHYKSRAKQIEGVTNRTANHARSDCKARLHLKLDKSSGLWVVKTFFDQHEHPLTTPSKRRHLKVNLNYSEAAKNLTKRFAEENLEVGKIPNFFGGVLNAPFDPRHCWNHVRKLREEQNGSGDAPSESISLIELRGNHTSSMPLILIRMAEQLTFFGLMHILVWLIKCLAMWLRLIPHTGHKYCMWHIKKKFGEKLGNVYFRRSSFKKELKNAIHNTWSHQEFEEAWQAVLTKFGLQNNEWLKEMFEIRHMWIPAYCRQTFSAGMKTTQRSESMNSFFNGYFTPKSSLHNFVVGYEKAVLKLMKNEQDENWVSIDKDRVLGKTHHLLEHAADVYTRKIFDKFAKEFENVYRLKAVLTHVDGEDDCFTVTYLVGIAVEWYVRMNFTSMVGFCTCCLFDFKGIPCKHLLHVFIAKYLPTIPSYFILKRWTKEATKSELCTNLMYYGNGATTVDEAAYVTDFFQRSMRLCYKAARSERGRIVFNEHLTKGLELLNEVDDQLLLEEHSVAPVNPSMVDDNASMMSSRTEKDTQRVEALLLDPFISQTKGRKKNNKKDNDDEPIASSKRIKGGMELSQRPARICSICHKRERHNARTCPMRKVGEANGEENGEEEDEELDDDYVA